MRAFCRTLIASSMAVTLLTLSGPSASANGDANPPDIDVDHGDGHPGNGNGGGGNGGGGIVHVPVCVWQTATSQQVEATARNAGVGGQIVREEAADPGIEVRVCDGVYDGRTWRTKPRPVTAQELAARAYVH